MDRPLFIVTAGGCPDGPSREFCYNIHEHKWTNREIDNAADGKKQFRVCMPSGRVIPVPNFYEALTDQFGKYHFDEVTFRDGFIPMAHERENWNQVVRLHLQCNLLTGQWGGSFEANMALSTLFEAEVAILGQRLQQLEARIRPIELIMDQVRDRSSVLNESMRAGEDVISQALQSSAVTNTSNPIRSVPT